MKQHDRLGSLCRATMAALFAFAAAQTGAQTTGPNVNMVSGTSWPGGDPFLQRQNEPSIAVSTRNPLHLFAGANDYRTVDLPGLPNDKVTGDAWMGIFTSYDGGATWRSTLLPGYPQDAGSLSPLHGFDAAADPTVRSGPGGLFFYSGIVFDRQTPDVTGRAKRAAHEHLAGVGGATNALFLARYIDNNNKENGEPIAYLDTRVVASNAYLTDTFIDKPWLAVDIPRKKAGECTITQDLGGTQVTQTVPAFNSYIAYSAFTGSGSNLTGRIFFTRSTDCGATWSSPIEIGGTNHVNQGVSLAVDPRTGTVYVSWRRFAFPRPPATPTESDAVVLTRSLDRGLTFTLPEVVATINPFDQGTLNTRFRTNSYPTMAVDRKGYVYIAWSQRGVGPGGDARLVTSEARFKSRGNVTFQDDNDDNGNEVPDPQGTKASWSAPAAVNNHAGRGHQVMPSMRIVAGKLQIAYIDLRDDHTWGRFTRPNGNWVEERVPTQERQDSPSNVFNQRVDDSDAETRRHTIDVWVAQGDADKKPTFVANRVSSYPSGSRPNSTTVEQMQFNAPNLPLFRQGTAAFAADYLDIAAQPFAAPDAKNWGQAKKSLTAGGTSFITFTDNRDVRAPRDGNWALYTPPSSPAFNANGTFEPGTPPTPCDPQFPERAGMRNQNIYLARVSQGLFVGAPGNAKPLGGFQRAFAVFVHNDTTVQKTFRLSIPKSATGTASFLQFSSLEQLDVAVLPRSSISRSVYVTSSDPKATVQVDVQEVQNGKVVKDGLQDSVQLNPDIANPDILNPDIMNPDIMNPDIMNAEVYNPDIMNPDIMNPDIMNPDIVNPDIMNPDIMNPDIMNPDIVNPDIMNPDIMNPDIMNPDIMNGSVSDTIWTITNNGNTTSAYNVELLLRSSTQVPEGFKTQLILLKTYTTPVSKDCRLMEATQNVIIASIPNPRFTPASAYTGFDPTDGSAKNATLWLAPGESAKAVLRVVDPNKNDDVTFNAAAEVAPFIGALAVNSDDAAAGSRKPKSATPSPTLFLQRPTDAPIGGLVAPGVSVLVQDDNGAPVSGATVTLSIVPNAGGATPHGNTAFSGPDGIATFPGLWFDRLGSSYRLVAVATAGTQTMTSGPSAAFNVVPLVVTTTADNGPGSLRRAIENANRNAGYSDSVSFAILGPAPHTIALASALPVITDPVTLDAATQPGYAGTPLIRLDGGTLAPSVTGIPLAASNSVVQGFMVTRCPGVGIDVIGASSSRITKNFVGTDGTSDLGNGSQGISIKGGASNIVMENVVSANKSFGVDVTSGATNTVFGLNKVGTDVTGTAALGNTTHGLVISASASGTIVRDNVFSGNGRVGIVLDGTTGNTIQGNKIGTNAAGTAALGNGQQGIWVGGSSSGNLIGGPSASTANVISGNGLDGLWIEAPAHDNIAEGNRIGTDAAGNVALLNGGQGITILGGVNNTLRANVVLGNTNYFGLYLGYGASGNLVENNRIGTNAAGTAKLGDHNNGVRISEPTSTGNTLRGNLISGSKYNGVEIIVGAHHNTLVGNKIGTDATGAYAIPNGAEGVLINQGAHDNVIGGTAPGDANLIAFNSVGIHLYLDAPANQIIGNVIWGNANNGITLRGLVTGTVIASNKIGTDAGATAALGNTGDGIGIYDGGSGNTVSDNTIAASTYNGLRLLNAGANTIRRNWVGTNAALVPGLGNAHQGISVATSNGTTIGGTSPGDGNVVAYNGQGGVGLEASATNTQILGNVVSGNNGNGIGVLDSQTATIASNVIGTNAAGTVAWPNISNGISVAGVTTTGIIVGGTVAGSGNLISGNGNAGILLNGVNAISVAGNKIGTDLTGTFAVPNTQSGVWADNGAHHNTIGGATAAARNLISGNGFQGVRLTNTHDNVVQGNLIGTNDTGTAAIPNAVEGVWLANSSGDTIGGLGPGEGNLISGNAVAGVVAGSSPVTGAEISGNLIGTNAAGTAALANSGYGVLIAGPGVSGITVRGNVISGNLQHGIQVQQAHDNTITGNLIGTNGTFANLGNVGLGIAINDAAHNTIGGSSAGAGNTIAFNVAGVTVTSGNSTDILGNVVSRNAAHGIMLTTSTSGTIWGNRIGTDPAGTSAAGNGGFGVYLEISVTGVTISENLISANGEGIRFHSSVNNTIRGNTIGTDVTRTARLPNDNGVVLVVGSSGNLVGGAGAGDGNVIAGNNGPGLWIEDGCDSTTVQGNWIGTNPALAGGLGNTSAGIILGSSNNQIGGSNPGAANVIAHNGSSGVYLPSGTGNVMLCNSIFGNGSLGISWATDPISSPGLTSAVDDGTQTTVAGAVNIGTPIPGVTLVIQFFANSTCEHSPYGEGETYLQSITAITNSDGIAIFSASLPTGLLGRVITATTNTLTGPGGNTSEFSACRTVTVP